jgi:hypothetical protein
MPGKIITAVFAVTAGLTLAACSPGTQQPKTAAGARAAARAFFNLYATSQWAAAYQLLSPAAQHAASESTWAKAQHGCPDQGAALAGTITSVTLAGNTAMVQATPHPGTAGWISTIQKFTYSEGRWRWSPGNLAIYHGRTVGQIVAALKTSGNCGI